MPGVFISYARDAQPLAETLSRALEERGISSWADFKDLQPGQRWREEVERALESADSFLILLSPHSQVGPWQEAEWQAALAKAWSDSQKTLIPIIIGEADPPPFLRNWVSLNVSPGSDPATWIPRVVDALRNRGGRTATSDELRSERSRRLEEIGHAARRLKDTESLPEEEG